MSATEADKAINAVIKFKKKKEKRNTLRKRSEPDPVAEEEEDETIIQPKKKSKPSLHVHTTEKQKAPEISVAFQTTGTAMPVGSADANATRTFDIDAPIVKNKSFSRFGPQQASSNIRVTCRFDYQPDICKDYKETGYCGYGDSCKFLHDRGDYKTGWQIDKEWDEQQKTKSSGDTNYEINEEEEDNLPFACFICREEFNEPVVTKCEHYFCQKCILEKFKKSKKCPVCNVNTDGIIKPAKKLLAKLEQQ